MKAHYKKQTYTEAEAREIALRVAHEEIDRYNREAVPRDRIAYMKIFMLAVHYALGVGEKRMKLVLDALGELTCDLHNLNIDGVCDDIMDKRLKECGLWDVYQQWAGVECVPLSENSKYIKLKGGDEA